ncbi:DNA polymerase I [Spiroplasma endosymbiont of Amphibalanus improvisus]|uniref:DNA polymerase I n=1 Tax=Spiroplasma endosymbiont of Amphibalanus improvisus TaxID=3066327 RepID=UPI00313E276F
MKILLIDGNYSLYRYYFATAYNNSNILRTSDNQPINAVYKFIKSINKFINENAYDSYVVCFDKSKKNYRHKILPEYKGNRDKTPDELRTQFPIAKEFLKSINLDYLEMTDFEADDLIGCLAKQAESKKYKVDILTGDKDLYQIVSPLINIVSPISGSNGEFKIIDEDYIFEKWNIKPIQIPDLKGLMGDASDNYKGVKGIGEKSAVKLLTEFETLENIISSIDKLKGSIKIKVQNDQDEAIKCKKIATIQTDCINYDYKFRNINKDLESEKQFYIKYEMNSFLKNVSKTKLENSKFKILKKFSLEFIDDKKENTLFVETLEDNYFTSKVLGIGLVNTTGTYFIKPEIAKEDLIFREFLEGKYLKNSYDVKKLIVIFSNWNLKINNIVDDLLLASYDLTHYIDLNLNYLNVYYGTDINLQEDKLVYTKQLKDYPEKFIEIIVEHIIKKTLVVNKLIPKVIKKLQKENVYSLYKEIDFPVCFYIAQMEINGIKIDEIILQEQIQNVQNKLIKLNKLIYKIAGEEINIQSPKQVQNLLFKKLKLSDWSKGSTSVDVLNKIKNQHEIVELILENRILNKLLNSYLLSFQKYILNDGKIHSIFKLTKTNTGRLSSVEPNIQTVSIKNDLQKRMRLFLIPSSDEKIFVSLDYSQIELRILAHFSNDFDLIDSFNNDKDIHAIVASKIFDINVEEVTFEQRRKAKVVNFGIIYGMSSFGLSEELNISIGEADSILKNYFLKSPTIKNYLASSIENAKNKGYVETIFKRKKYIPEVKSSNTQIFNKGARMAQNMPIQGTAADILKLAIIKINEKVNTMPNQPKLVAQIHDELIFEVSKTDVEKMAKLIANEMENVFKFKVPLKVNFSYGENWFKLK